MTSPAYTIGRDELLLITTRWADGQTVLLEVPVRQYKAQEIQALIDETVSDRCDVVDIEVYDCVKKSGQSIADEFTGLTWADRCEEEAEEEVRVNRVRRPVYSTLNHAQQGIGARA